MRGVISGDGNAAIAESPGLSPATVKKHLENVFRKLGVTRRTRAAAYCLELLAGT